MLGEASLRALKMALCCAASATHPGARDTRPVRASVPATAWSLLHTQAAPRCSLSRRSLRSRYWQAIHAAGSNQQFCPRNVPTPAQAMPMAPCPARRPRCPAPGCRSPLERHRNRGEIARRRKWQQPGATCPDRTLLALRGCCLYHRKESAFPVLRRGSVRTRLPACRDPQSRSAWRPPHRHSPRHRSSRGNRRVVPYRSR